MCVLEPCECELPVPEVSDFPVLLFPGESEDDVFADEPESESDELEDGFPFVLEFGLDPDP